jgi:hypothetical protein
VGSWVDCSEVIRGIDVADWKHARGNERIVNVRHDEPRASHPLQRGVGGEEASRQTYFQQHQAETKSVSISSILALAEYEWN